MKTADALKHLNGPMGLNLDDHGLTRFIEEVVDDGGDEPAEYVFVGKVGRGRVTAKQLTEFRYCDAAIEAATGQVVDHIKPPEWRKVRRLLAAAKTTEKLGPEAGVAGTVRDRLVDHLRTMDDYLDDPEPHEITAGLTHGWPVRINGRVWFSVETMLDQLDTKRIRYVRREHMRGLLALGCCEKSQHWYTPLSEGAKKTSRIMYAVPEDVMKIIRDRK